jgi:hypothetical protein
MNLTALEQKLISAARASAPDDRVPYAFEKRIMARLADVAPVDLMSLWGRALWRAAVPCLSVALLLGAWSLWQGRSNNPATASMDFPKEFENAVLIAADQSRDSW